MSDQTPIAEMGEPVKAGELDDDEGGGLVTIRTHSVGKECQLSVWGFGCRL